MKKYLYRLVTAVFAVVFCLGILGIPVGAESIDLDRSASIKIVYANDGVCYEGLEIELYRVASVKDGYSFQLDAPFNNYSVNVNDVQSQDEWRSVATTLSSYAVADGIAPTAKGVTDENGIVEFADLLPGMYLTMGVRKQIDKDIVVFENFLTVVPYPSNDGDSYLYDLTVYPKSSVYTPKEGTVTYKVLKQWKDEGKTQIRPENVKIDIYKDGKLSETVTLSSENNWMYSWKAADDASEWRVVEREVPEGYFVTVSDGETTFIVTNSVDSSYDVPDDPNPPQTGYTVVPLPYVLALCISGCFLVVLSIRLKKRTA